MRAMMGLAFVVLLMIQQANGHVVPLDYIEALLKALEDEGKVMKTGLADEPVVNTDKDDDANTKAEDTVARELEVKRIKDETKPVQGKEEEIVKGIEDEVERKEVKNEEDNVKMVDSELMEKSKDENNREDRKRGMMDYLEVPVDMDGIETGMKLDHDLIYKLDELKDLKEAREPKIVVMKIAMRGWRENVIWDKRYKDIDVRELTYPYPYPEHIRHVKERVEELLRDAPRYIAIRYVHKERDGRVSYPLCWFYYNPDGARMSDQMKYSSTLPNVARALGTSNVVRLEDVDDFIDWWKDNVNYVVNQ